MKQTGSRIRVADNSAAVLQSLHPHIKKKLRTAFQVISDNPDAGKALGEELEGLMSYRVSRFRIIYRVGPDRRIEIIVIGPRVRIYEETYRLIRKQEIRQNIP